MAARELSQTEKELVERPEVALVERPVLVVRENSKRRQVESGGIDETTSLRAPLRGWTCLGPCQVARVLSSAKMFANARLPWSATSREAGEPHIPHGSGLGSSRWVVERTSPGYTNTARLRIRYERRADFHQALLDLARSLICHRQLQSPSC